MKLITIQIQFITNVIENYDLSQVTFHKGWVRVETAPGYFTYYPEHQILHVKEIQNEHNDDELLQESDQNSDQRDEIPSSADC